MESGPALAALPIALAVIMFGLGLDLTLQDFARIGRRPKPVAVALACQLFLLPLICFGLVILFALPPLLAVGMMLLAASPGGTVANLYSHLFRGDVALNISLTAINSIIAVVTLPLVVNLAIAFFQPGDLAVGLQFRKTVEVFLLVLGPVAIGMLVRGFRPGFADAMDRPVRIASVVILTVVVVGAALSNLDVLVNDLPSLAGITVSFCVLSLGVGYVVPRLLRIDRPQAVASAFEVGIHNATLAIVVAQSVLVSPQMSLPAAVYGVLMFPLAALFGLIIKRRA